MAGARPSVKEGLGEKPQFKELNFAVSSHEAAEFTTDDNIFKIKLKCPKAIRSTFQLKSYEDGSEKDVENAVFSQMEGDQMVFRLAVPKPGWHKLNIFAAPADKQGSMPCVYTYLMNLTKVKKAAIPYPKQFADFTTACSIKHPKFLDTSKDLSKVEFKVEVPKAKRVAVKANDEWTQLENKGGNTWQGYVNLNHYKGQNADVNINACLGEDETSFATLLKYTV